MDTDSSIPAPLPVIRVIRDAFQFIWDKRTRLLCALAVPVALMFVVEYAFTFSQNDPLMWIQVFIQMAIYILFAITCHRLAIIGDSGVPNYGLLTWTKREWQYLGWAFVILIIWMFFSLVINSFFVSIIINDVEAGASVESFRSTKVFLNLFYIPFVYIFSRLSVLYPAIAVDLQVNVQWAWQLTAHTGWRLTLVVAVLPGALYFLVSLLIRENATFAENTILEFLGFILLAVEIVALSFSYKYLTETEA